MNYIDESAKQNPYHGAFRLFNVAPLDEINKVRDENGVNRVTYSSILRNLSEFAELNNQPTTIGRVVFNENFAAAGHRRAYSLGSSFSVMQFDFDKVPYDLSQEALSRHNPDQSYVNLNIAVDEEAENPYKEGFIQFPNPTLDKLQTARLGFGPRFNAYRGRPAARIRPSEYQQLVDNNRITIIDGSEEIEIVKTEDFLKKLQRVHDDLEDRTHLFYLTKEQMHIEGRVDVFLNPQKVLKFLKSVRDERSSFEDVIAFEATGEAHTATWTGEFPFAVLYNEKRDAFYGKLLGGGQRKEMDHLVGKIFPIFNDFKEFHYGPLVHDLYQNPGKARRMYGVIHKEFINGESDPRISIKLTRNGSPGVYMRRVRIPNGTIIPRNIDSSQAEIDYTLTGGVKTSSVDDHIVFPLLAGQQQYRQVYAPDRTLVDVGMFEQAPRLVFYFDDLYRIMKLHASVTDRTKMSYSGMNQPVLFETVSEFSGVKVSSVAGLMDQSTKGSVIPQ